MADTTNKIGRVQSVFTEFQETLWKRSIGPWVRQFEEPTSPRNIKGCSVGEIDLRSSHSIITCQGLLLKRKNRKWKKKHRKNLRSRNSPCKKKFNYDPSSDKKIQGDPRKTVIVARLAHSTTNTTLAQTFRKYGTVVRHRLISNLKSGKSKCYGFVEFSEEAMVKAVCDFASKDPGIMIDGRKVLVDRVRAGIEESWLPGRLGGGLGSRKKRIPSLSKKLPT